MSASAEILVDTLAEQVLVVVREELAARGWFQVEASGRHVHLAADDAKQLFGSDYALAWAKYLSQPGQFVSGQRIAMVGPTGRLEDAVVIGPERARTQIEVSKTDALLLGVDPPCRDSGNLEDTPSIQLEYGSNVLETKGGVIIAERHIHMKPESAAALGLSDGDRVDFVLDSPRPLTFRDVKVRVAASADNFMHIDYDEANAAGFSVGMFGSIYREGKSTGRKDPMNIDALVEEVVERLMAKIRLEQSGDLAGTVSEVAPKASGCNCNYEAQPNKKLLVTETVATGVAPNSKVSYPKGTVITPLAKDCFKQRGVVVEFE